MNYESNRSRTTQFTGKVGTDDVLYYSFSPNAMISKARSGGNMVSPFCWTTSPGEELEILPRAIGDNADSDVRLMNYVSNDDLFPQFDTSKLSMARIVASSMQITRQDRNVDLSGTAVGVRSYGTKTVETFPTDSDVTNKGMAPGQVNRNIDPSIIRNAYFRSEVDMKDPEAHLYVNTIPLDYSDLDMHEINTYFTGDNFQIAQAAPRAPILSGKVTG